MLKFQSSNSTSRIDKVLTPVPRQKVVALATAVFTLLAFLAGTMTMATAFQPKIVKRRLVWHRNRDLRFHDHPFYEQNDEATTTTTTTTSAFVFDDAFGCGIKPSTCLPDQWKAVHLGPHGMRVLLESVQDLNCNLQEKLVVRRGPTIPVLLGLVEELIQMDNNNNSANTEDCQNLEYRYEVCWNEEPGWDEQQLSQDFRAALDQRFQELESQQHHKIRLCIRTTMSCTLYHPDDLPAPGEWQPLSKKEKRRRQKQQAQRKQKSSGKKSQAHKSPSNEPVTSHQSNNSNNNLQTNYVVDVSFNRWAGMPRIMGDFRKIAREKAGIRECKDRNELPPPPQNRTIDPGVIPSLEELLEPLLTYVDDESDPEKLPILGLPASMIKRVCENSLRIHKENLRSMENQEDTTELSYRGGETAALKHLDDFVTNYAHTAQRSLACVDNHQSSRLSHYLAFGCRSPQRVVAAAEAAIAARKQQQQEQEQHHSKTNNNENDGTWLISHMTMRDFFLYTCLASGKQFYQLEGIPVSQKVAASMEWRSFGSPSNPNTKSHELWRDWATGRTGLPLVDAAMAELLETGYCSNRVRQNAASVLTKDLQLDWRAGAEWFQFLLQDHCVGANWGNWLYFSGVGPDPKNRHFCTVSQALKYDPHGTYVKRWIPSLRNMPSSNINDNASEEYFLRPWDFDPSWKRPLVDPETQYTWRDLERLKETGRLLEDTTISN